MRSLRAALGILFVCLIFIFPFVTDNNFYLQLLTTAATTAIMAMGYNVLFGLTGQISVGHAAFYAIGGYVTVIMGYRLEVPFFLSIFAGMLAAALIALVVGFPLLRLKGHYLALGTLGFGMIVYTVLMQWQDLTGGPSGIPVPKSTVLGYTLSQRDFYLLAMVLVIIMFVISQRMAFSYIGRALKAIREDEEAAQTLGIRVAYYKIMAFVFSAVLAALAGGIYPLANRYITPELFGVDMSIKLLTIVVIGGVGNNAGAVLGSVLLTVLPQLLTVFQDYELLLFGLIMFLVVILMPKGLISLFSKGTKIRFREKNVPTGQQLGNLGEITCHFYKYAT